MAKKKHTTPWTDVSMNPIDVQERLNLYVNMVQDKMNAYYEMMNFTHSAPVGCGCRVRYGLATYVDPRPTVVGPYHGTIDAFLPVPVSQSLHTRNKCPMGILSTYQAQAHANSNKVHTGTALNRLNDKWLPL